MSCRCTYQLALALQVRQSWRLKLVEAIEVLAEQATGRPCLQLTLAGKWPFEKTCTYRWTFPCNCLPQGLRRSLLLEHLICILPRCA